MVRAPPEAFVLTCAADRDSFWFAPLLGCVCVLVKGRRLYPRVAAPLPFVGPHHAPLPYWLPAVPTSNTCCRIPFM